VIPVLALALAACGGEGSAEQALRFTRADGFWNRPVGVELFVADLEDTPGGADVGRGTNEASTEQEDAGGWVEFDAVGCEPGDEVSFTVDAVPGSEFGDDEPIAAEGSLRVRLGQPPPGL